MANWLRNVACPHCGSKNNLALYDDGSEWCWGCKHYKPPNLIQSYQSRNNKPQVYNNVYLPEDTTTYLPEVAKAWLDKYSLTEEEKCRLSLLYSYEKDLLIFPVYDSVGTLLMYQGRYFGDNPDYPKYLTYGAKDVLHILGPVSDRIVVVEDVVSAAKIASVTTVMPLWGSNLGLKDARRLSERFKRLTLWLDMDKAKESLVARSRLSMLFDEVTCVVTELDPKEYDHEQIRGFLGLQLVGRRGTRWMK